MRFPEKVAVGLSAFFLATALYLPKMYADSHSLSEEINTSQGKVILRNWQTPKGIEVVGIDTRGNERFYDLNRDGKLDGKVRSVSSHRLGAYSWNEKPTESDQKLYSEIISKTTLDLK